MSRVPACPQCGFTRVWKDGIRRLTDGPVIQRWLCRECGYRFSDPSKTSKRKDPHSFYCRVGEIFRLKWIDVNFEKGTIHITPEKGSHARIFKMSPRLKQMLLQLPRNDERILSRYKNVNSLRRTFERRRVAFKLGNPRLLRISFHTFRH